jgi:YHS domain-containing protein
MRRILFYLFSASAIIFSACNNNQSDKSSNIEQPDSTQKGSTAAVDSAKKKITVAMVDNKKDPNCGMPVTAGIEDTVHYKGKVYGFCSDECKQAFLKNPDALAKNADLK